MATKNNAALDAMRSYARQNRGQTSSSGSGYVTPTKQSAIEEFANIISNSRNNPKPTVPVADVSAGTSGPAAIQTTTAPEATVQPIQTPELDKATGNTNAAGPLAAVTPERNTPVTSRMFDSVSPSKDREYSAGDVATNVARRAVGDAIGGVRNAINYYGSYVPTAVADTFKDPTNAPLIEEQLRYDFDNDPRAMDVVNEWRASLRPGEYEALEMSGQLPDARTMYAQQKMLEMEAAYRANYEEPELKSIVDFGRGFQAETENRYGDMTGFGRFLGDVAGSLGQQTPAMALNRIPYVGPAASAAYLMGSAAGGATEQAYAEGATLQQAVDYGTLSGAVEVATEKLFDGMAGLLGKGMADDVVEGLIKRLTAEAGSNAMRNALRIGFSAAGESAEEGIGFLVDPILKSIYNNKTAQENYKDINWKDGLYQMLLGAASGGMLSTLGLVNGQYDAKNAALDETTQRVVTEVVNDVLTNTPEGQAVVERADSAPVPEAEQANPAPNDDRMFHQPVNRSGANQILFDPAQRAAFEQETGVSLSNMSIRDAANLIMEYSRQSAETGQTGFDVAYPIKTPPAPQQFNRPLSRSEAQRVANDPTLRALFEQETGRTIPGKKYAVQFIQNVTAQLAEQANAPAAPTSPIAQTVLNNEQRTQTNEISADEREAIVDRIESLTRFADQLRIRGDTQQEAEVRTQIAELNRQLNGGQAEQQTGAANPTRPVTPAPAPQTQPTAQTAQQTAAPQGRTTPMRVEPAPADAEGTRLSASVPTVQNAPSTSPEFSAIIDKTVSENGYRYIPITNNETVQKATQRIQREGWERARANWTADVRSGKTSAEMMATGALLYNNAVNAGDLKAAADIMADYVAAGTNTAQALQARKIIQSMQPEMRLYMIDSTIARLSENLAKKLPDGINISQELRDEYMRATTDEQRDEIVSRMQKEVADQIPSTFKDKWTALRYVNMLGNFRTQARNILGNTTMAAITSAKNAVQTLFESVASAVTGGRVQRTTSLFADRDLVQAAREYYNANSDAINGEGKYSDNRTATGFMKGVEDQRRIFKTGIMEGYRKATNWAMTRGDTVFIGSRFARTLAGYLQANGMDAATFSGIQNGSIEATADQQALIDKAINYATQEAQEATFHDNNTLSTWISQIGRKPGTPKFARLLSEGIMPFRKTPANVLIRAEEYSPLGFVNATVKAVQAAKGTNNVTANDVVNSLSKAFTGTGIFLLGMLLRNAGWLSGHEDDDKQKGFNDLQGEQEYALNLPGGKSITIDWMSPASVPLFLGVQMMDAVNDGGFELKDLEKVFTSITDPMIQMSMLQGVNDTLSNVKYAENNLVQVGLSSALSYLTQGLTNTMLGQLERTVEDRRTTTYVDKDSNLPSWAQRAIGKAAEKVPIKGADFQQVEYLDAWGRPDMYEENGFARAFNNFINPGYVSQTNSTEVDNELQRLYDAGMGNVFPQRISMSDKIAVYDEHGQKTGERQLTADEYVQVQREAGQTKLQMVKDLMALPMYEGMSDDAKADAISAIYQYANYEAIRKVEPSHEDKNAEIASLSNIPAYFAAKEAYQDAADNRWNRDYEELNNVLDSFDTLAPDVQKTLLEKNSQLRLVRDAYDAGMSTENWFKAYDATRDLTPYGDHKEVTDWQKYQAMANVSTDEDMDIMLRGYLEGSSYDKYMAVRNEGVSARAWADAMAESGKVEPLPGKDTVAEWQKYQAIASGSDAKTADAIFKANLADSTYARYTFARDAGITPQQWADTNASVAQLPVLDGNKAVANWQKVNYVGGSNMTDAQKDALMILYFDKGEGNKISTYDKYMLCRNAGFAPVHIAKFYEIMQTAQGVDKDGDGKTDSGTKKKAILAAAMAYGFNEKNAERLYNMWQNGHW